LRIAFLGTPPPAVPPLRALVAAPDVDVTVVITNPDRPRGRSGRPVPPPVKEAAGELGIEVWQPHRPAEVTDELASLDLDAAAVVAYGSILPPRVLDTTRHGFVNLHFSLLPRWRGAAPVQHALRAGDTRTGLTTFVLDEGMDTGPVLDRLEVEVGTGETAGELEERLAELGADLLVRSVRRLVDGARPTPQPEDGVTLAPKVDREDVAIDWTAPAADVVALVRSANPRPGAHTTHRGDDLKVWRSREAAPDEVARPLDPGAVVATAVDGPIVAAGEGAAVLTEVQPAGRRRMDGASFVNGYRIAVGERLGGTT
jgi:methionyl-tRNA formyltransferase